MKILLSAVGTTDPVRGCHDGSMLHIARRYRPEVVVLFISEEMRQADEKDHRYARGFDMLAEHTGGYRPIVERIELGPEYNVADFDVFDRIYRKAICDCLAKYSGSEKVEFLLNLSSGTTQMKSAWQMIAVEGHWKTTAVQVTTPTGKANQEEHTLKKNYDVELELALNEDNEPDAPDRTLEPDLSSMRGALFGHQVYILINRYEYDSALALFDGARMSRENAGRIRALLAYAAARQKQDVGAIKKALEKMPTEDRKKLREEQSRLYEYALLLSNLQQTDKISEFVFRMNPFIIELEIRYLEKFYNMPPLSYMDKNKEGYRISSSKLLTNYPVIYKAVCSDLKDDIRDALVSQKILHLMLKAVAQAEDKAFFKLCFLLNQRRNDIAHQLYAMNENDVVSETEHGTGYFIENAKSILCRIEDDVNAQSFTTYNPYKRINDMIEALLYGI